MTITKRELTADNIAAFGTAYTAKHLRKTGVPFSIAYWLMFGRAPRRMCAAYNPVRLALMRRAADVWPA